MADDDLIKEIHTMITEQRQTLVSVAENTGRSAEAAVRLGDIMAERQRYERERETRRERAEERQIEAERKAAADKTAREERLQLRLADWWSANGNKAMIFVVVLAVFLFGDEASRAMLADYLPDPTPDPIVVQVPVREAAPLAQPLAAPHVEPPSE